jgi:hypothetical protein
VILAALVVAGGIILGYANLHVEADAIPPARLAPFVEYGRSRAEAELGLAGMVPFRLVEASCAPDGMGVLLFESARADRFYTVISAPPPSDAPDAVMVVGAMTAAEFADSEVSKHLGPCDGKIRPLASGESWLPVAWSLFNGTHLCGGGGFVKEPRLRGSADDPRRVWMEDASGKRIELAWPPGFSVRFTPRLEVLNARGDVVALDGSRAASGCGTGDENAMYVDFWR